jgi:RNA polymerase sigma-70 factor (ECF subfamily)
MTHPQDLAHQGPEWIERLRQGDEAAFESLFRAFAPGLCAFVARYVDSQAVAEEIVQDLFLTIWRRRADLVVEQSVATYLFTAARNRAVNHLRHERVARRWEGSIVGRIESPGASAESELLEMLDLQDGIERLPARCRLIFTLSRQQGMTYAQIAESLGLSVKTVEVQMGRALRALRAWVKRPLP